MKKGIWKKIAAGALSLALAFSAVGCGSNGTKESETKEKEKVSITMWHYYSGAQKSAFDRMVSEFNESVGLDKGIAVTAKAMGSIADLTAAIQNSAEEKVGAEELPDMFITYIDTAKQIDEMGKLASLDSYFTEKELDAYVEEYIDEGRFDAQGNLKVFPIAKATEVMMTNKTEWDRFAAETGASVDELATWEGLVRISEKYYDWSGGKAFFGRDAMANYLLAGSMELGEEIFVVKDGKVTINFNEQIMRRLWDNYYVPYVKGYFYKEGRYASDDLKVGNILSYVGSTSSASYFPTSVYLNEDDSGTPIECMVTKVPGFEGVTKPVVVQQGAGCAVIKSTTDRENACAEFLKWFTERDRNMYFALIASYMPVMKEANRKENVETVMKDNNLELPDTVLDTMRVSIEEASESLLYTTEAFDKGYDARGILEKTLKDKSMADKAAIDELIASGTSREAALSQYVTEENFKSWYEDTLSQLETLLGN